MIGVGVGIEVRYTAIIVCSSYYDLKIAKKRKTTYELDPTTVHTHKKNSIS